MTMHLKIETSVLKIAFQNQFVRRHLFVKMYFLAVGDRSKSLLIHDTVFAYSSMVNSCRNQPLAIGS